MKRKIAVPITGEMIKWNDTVNGGAKATVIKTLVYEKMYLNAMLLVLAIGAKLPPHMIQNHKTVPKEKMSRGINVTRQPKY